MPEHELARQGWMLDGWTSMLLLVGWMTVVVVYALGRSIGRPQPDSIRPSGPID